MKYLMVFFLMLIPWLVQAQEGTYKFERAIALRLAESDTTKYEFLYSMNKCGKFVVDTTTISFNLEGEKTSTYYIAQKIIHLVVNKSLVYNRCVDFDSEEQIVVYVDKTDGTVNVGKFNEGRYYLYIFYIKEL